MRWTMWAVAAALATTAAAADRKILVHGHRGARSVLPENTVPAFEYAIKSGADVIELDLGVTKDNVLVVSHDPVVNGAICEGPHVGKPIRNLTLAQIRELDCGKLKNLVYPQQKPVPGTQMPTLDEVLALAPKGDFWFNIEAKLSSAHPEYAPAPQEFARMVLDAIRKHKLEKRVIFQSFDFRVLHAMDELAPEIRLAALFQSDSRDFVEIVREAKADIAAPNYKLVTKEKVEKAHEAGIPVVPWTPNTPEEWKVLVDAGVDAIITDDPARLITFLKTQGRR